MKTWLVSQLGSKNEIERAKAEKTLEGLGQAGIDLVMELVREEATRRRKKRARNRVIGGILALIIAVIVSIWLINGIVTGKWGHANGPWWLIAKGLGALFGAYAVSNAQAAGIKWLTQFQDPRLVSSLLDAMDTDDKELQSIAEKKLIELLPVTEPQHGDLLTLEQRAILHKQLKSENTELVKAVLGALVVMADVAAIPDVQALIHRRENGVKPDRELISVAQRTLRDLEGLKEQARLKETLLRPATAAPGEHLLRPDLAPQTSDPATLLRPTQY